MIKRTLTIKNHKDFSEENWGLLYGLNDNCEVIYYTGQTNDAYIAIIPILLTSTIDNIGYMDSVIDSWYPNTKYNEGSKVYYSGFTYVCVIAHESNLSFDDDNWIKTPNDYVNENTITYTGSTRINEFRRYGKLDNDVDLYNPVWNTGYTQIISTSYGISKQITNAKPNTNALIPQDLYEYRIWNEANDNSVIMYSDINSSDSIITYTSSGLTNSNSILYPMCKLDYLMGVIEKPKIEIDVYVDRGNNSSYDKHLKLGDVKSLNDLELYGNGYFKIKEN